MATPIEKKKRYTTVILVVGFIVVFAIIAGYLINNLSKTTTSSTLTSITVTTTTEAVLISRINVNNYTRYKVGDYCRVAFLSTNNTIQTGTGTITSITQLEYNTSGIISTKIQFLVTTSDKGAVYIVVPPWTVGTINKITQINTTTLTVPIQNKGSAISYKSITIIVQTSDFFPVTNASFMITGTTFIEHAKTDINGVYNTELPYRSGEGLTLTFTFTNIQYNVKAVVPFVLNDYDKVYLVIGGVNP